AQRRRLLLHRAGHRQRPHGCAARGLPHRAGAGRAARPDFGPAPLRLVCAAAAGHGGRHSAHQPALGVRAQRPRPGPVPAALCQHARRAGGRCQRQPGPGCLAGLRQKAGKYRQDAGGAAARQ
nr:hypothetical protein [Tanacetum cinerariifolium]